MIKGILTLINFYNENYTKLAKKRKITNQVPLIVKHVNFQPWNDESLQKLDNKRISSF